MWQDLLQEQPLIGQVVIPVPIVGGFVGGIKGSFIGKYVRGLAVS